MGEITRKLFLSMLSLFLVYLIASTSSTTIVSAAGPWGTLEAGNEMKWQSEYLHRVFYIEIEILNVDGKVITYERSFYDDTNSLYRTENVTANADSYTKNDLSTIGPYIVPKSKLWGDIVDYEFQGVVYKAYYTEGSFKYSHREDWRDFNTGILFEHKDTERKGKEFYVYTTKLISTNADLAEVSGSVCFGTLFIALFSVSTVVSYSLVRFWKRKKPI